MDAPRGSNDVAVETTALTRRFDGLTAVDGVDFRIRHGEIFGLLGANGAGKSTMMKMLTTLLPPTSGTARVGGFDIVGAPAEVRRHIGYVPQLLSADGALTGHENLRLSAKLYGLPRSERSARIADALAFMELAAFAHKLVRTYSGGMVRRLELAQAMLHRPGILFLDEPTIGLDPMARHSVWNRLRDLRRAYGMTVVITRRTTWRRPRRCATRSRFCMRDGSRSPACRANCGRRSAGTRIGAIAELRIAAL